MIQYLYPTALKGRVYIDASIHCLTAKSKIVIDDFLPYLLVEAKWPSSSKSKSQASAQLGNTIKPKLLQDPPTVTLRLASFHDDDAYSDENYGKGAAANANSANKATPCVLSANVTYVLTLTDPDAPSRDNPKWSEFCHWIATGLARPSPAFSPSSTPQLEEGRCLSAITFSPSTTTTIRGDQKLDDLIEYKPPGPPEKTGKHRYVFLVFVPANGTTEELHLSKPEGRQRWGYDDDDDVDQDEHEAEAGWEENGRVGVRRWARENGLIAAGELYFLGIFVCLFCFFFLEVCLFSSSCLRCVF